MKLNTRSTRFLAPLALSVGLFSSAAWNASAAILVDDTWADGTRTNQNLPTQSAWFTTSAGNAAVYPNALSFTNVVAGSSQWATYFTASGSPSRLNVGDTLTVELSFTVTGINAANSSQTLRLGLYDSSAGARLSADGNPNGTSYTGYALFIRPAATWAGTTGLQHLKRRADFLSNSGLLATTGNYDAFTGGGSDTGTPAFSNDVPYKLTITYSRIDAATNMLTATLSGGDLTNSLTVLDGGTANTTTIYTNFDCLVIRPSAAESTATNFIFTEFKVTGPSGVPGAPQVVTQPQNMTVEVAETAFFSISASGGQPLSYQWYFNTVGTPLANATNSSLLLSDVQSGQAGSYFCIVTNTLGSDQSSSATLTVNTPTFTSLGLVVDDTWSDADRGSGAFSLSNSIWFASTSDSLTVPEAGSMLGLPNTTSSRTWIGYFTDDGSPVDLAIGDAIRATVVFTPTNPAPQNTGNLRMGLFTYANGGTRPTSDGTVGTGAVGGNVRGYMLTVNFGQTFGSGTPLQFFVRTSLGSADLLGTTGDYTTLGSGPNGNLAQPAFSNGHPYTLQFTISRLAEAKIRCEAHITGPSLDITHTGTETNYNYRRFDAFGVRPANSTTSAEAINFSEFKVEVITAPELPSFQITAVTRPDDTTATVRWNSISGRTYQVHSRDSLSTGSWATNTEVTATTASTTYTDSAATVYERYYRVVGLP